MRLKIKGHAKQNPLTKGLINSIMREEMISISEKALPMIKKNLNSTEEPDKDPRRAHINVKEWRAIIVSKRRSADIGYTVLLRAINSQAPSSYIAYRRPKERTRRKTKWYDPLADKPLSKEEKDAVIKYAKETYELARKKGNTPRQSSIARKSILNRYKKLIPVKVTVDNIAFSRLFSSKNVIRPNPSKYNSYDYARCLKIWDTDANKFRYASHANPKSNNDNYYYSRVHTITQTIEEMIDNQ